MFGMTTLFMMTPTHFQMTFKITLKKTYLVKNKL